MGSIKIADGNIKLLNSRGFRDHMCSVCYKDSNHIKPGHLKVKVYNRDVHYVCFKQVLELLETDPNIIENYIGNTNGTLNVGYQTIVRRFRNAWALRYSGYANYSMIRELLKNKKTVQEAKDYIIKIQGELILHGSEIMAMGL